jgi:hypothetical protein
MSAPPPDSPMSISSSGHSDGLGRRVIVFDREDGAMLEALHVRPEIGAFEAALRERIERLATFEDERFARIRGVDRDPDTGDLIVVSEFVPGTRLSDLLDGAQEAAQDGITPGVDVALGYLLEALPAISALHASAGVPHGAIAPARTVLTPAGQIVFLDPSFGGILERLHFSRKRLWTEFGLAMPASAGPARLDVSADIGQIALNAVMLVLGRPLRAYEYPDALPLLMTEVVEVAQIRGTPAFAAGIQHFLQRALPLPGSRSYLNADDATVDLRQAAEEIGVLICRRALFDFMWAAEGLSALQSWSPSTDPTGDDDVSDFVAELLGEDDDGLSDLAEDTADTTVEETPLEQEIALDGDDSPISYEITASPHAHVDQSVEEFTRLLKAETETDDVAAVAETATHVEPQPAVADPFVWKPVAREPVVPEPAAAEPFAPEPVTAERSVPEFVVPEPFVPEPVVEEPERAVEPLVPEPVAAEPVAEESEVDEPVGPEAVAEEPLIPEPAESPRRKRLRSVRARKDRLRSIAAAVRPGAVASQPRMAPAPLTSPDRAAAYEQGTDDYSPATRAIGFAPPPPAPAPPPPAPASQPAFAPAAFAPASAPIPMPQFPAPPPSPYSGQSATIWSAPPDPPAPGIKLEPPAAAIRVEPSAAPIRPVPLAPPKPLALVPPPSPVPSASGTIKLKTDSGSGSAVRAPRVEPRIARAEPHAAVPHIERPVPEESREFPWKLAAAAIIIVAAGIVGGRWYLTSRPVEGADAPAAAAADPAAGSKAVPRAAVSAAGTAHIDIQTQPPGAHVLLDGQAAGETPVKLDVTPGRHVLTFVSASGSVKRNVRVEAGKTITVDVPLFSGWVAIFAPVVLDIAENGRSIGSTEDGRLMLAPGRHELTLSNRELGYSGKQTVDIDAGEVNSVSLEPRGSVNFNAIPWAEVWIDGKKAGETPIANAQVPLGVREIVFKNPEFGERRMVTTVRADSADAVSVDFTKK